MEMKGESGIPLSNRKFKQESRKKVKTLLDLADAKTIKEEERFLKIKTRFSNAIIGAKTNDILSFERTPKIPFDRCSFEVLSDINRAIAESLNIYPSSSLTEIAKIYQSAQKVYHDFTQKERAQSKWVESIENKIMVQKDELTLIANYEQNRKGLNKTQKKA